MATDSSDHWSDYWSRGCLTSLPEDFAANYDAEVAEFWNSVFDELPDKGHVLDVCTGNGAIALLAAQFSRQHQRQLELLAIDAAQIDIAAMTAHHASMAGLVEMIRFAGGIQVEDLPFDNDRFDLVTSQYGIEYGEWEKAAAEVFRVLKPGGRLVMVNHSAGSDILQTMQQERQQYEMLEKSGLFSAMGSFLDGNASPSRLRNELAGLYRNLEMVAQRGAPPLFRSVHQLLAGLFSRDDESMVRGKPHLRQYFDQLRHGSERLSDMLRVNQAIADQPAWWRVFERAGLVLRDSGDLQYRGNHHAGAWFQFDKPATDS